MNDCTANSLTEMIKDEIREKYYQLIEIVTFEVSENTNTKVFLDYLKSKEDSFNTIEGMDDILSLREFIRGVNRYSDEFIFSDKYSFKIKALMNDLYEILTASTLKYPKP